MAEKAGLREGHHLLQVGRSLAGPERMGGGVDGRSSGLSMCVK